MLGALGGVALGAQGSLGWLHGYGGYGQISLNPSGIVSLRSRLSYDWLNGGAGFSGTGRQTEASASVMADVRIYGSWRARASVMGTMGITPISGSSLTRPFGIIASGSVGGLF
jgi:hypothetical protein